MPELPEVEAARGLIEARGLHRTIAAVDDRDSYVCRPHAPGEIAGALVGAQLTTAERIGKSMWCETDRGVRLGLHLGMAGRIMISGERAALPDSSSGPRKRAPAADVTTQPSHRYYVAGDPVDDGPTASSYAGHPDPGFSSNPQWARFTLTFEDGGELLLYDKRRLGRAVLDPDLSTLGPDAAVITRAAFRERVGRGDGPLKARIMDQSVLAGVGNLLADEALWRAGLSPVRPAGGLAPEDLDELRKQIRATTRDAIRKGGVHTGKVIPFRKAGAACPRCGATMRRATVGGRTTWWCPAEQR